MATSAARVVTGRLRGTGFGPGGQLLRLVGTLDYKGKGTFHILHDMDPCVLCDAPKDGVAIPAGKPDFGMHPHYGVIACTVVLEGAFSSADNLNGADEEPNEAGGIYAASSGKGICHEEKSIMDGSSLVQCVFRIPQDKLDLPPAVCQAKAAELPVLADECGTTIVLVGSHGGVTSPATPPAFPNAALLRVKVPPGKAFDLSLPEERVHGFVWPLAGCGKIGPSKVEVKRGNDELLCYGKGDVLNIENAGEEAFDALILSGQPLTTESWVKGLGNNGFGIFRDVQEADAILSKAVAAGTDFTYKTLI
mmetsp:Transcript_45609/g.105858  ORF Transcript_45609/g.105858 Transcript_45609/m.105858 type:complete len:307 (-) Transcript_45609:114-1034(-)